MPNLKRFVGANKLSMQLIFIYIKAWIIQCCGAGFSWFYPILLIFSLAWLPAHVFSSQAGVTPAMIEKFKSLPDEQKKSMAEQFGIEFPMGGLDIPVEREIQIPVTLDQSRAVNFQEMVEEDEKDRLSNSGDKFELPRFGANIFDANLTNFVPTDNILPPGGYALGSGDQLSVKVFGKDPIDVRLEIDRNGQITLPRLGSIDLGGLTFDQARRVISDKISTRMLGGEVVVALGRLREINVFLAGEVVAPGSYNVSALTSVSQALYLSGGITDIGSYRLIQVRRLDGSIVNFDLYDLLLAGKRDNDVFLRSGDVVFVPVAKTLISITGEVRRQGVYEALPADTLLQSIDLAGGMTSSSDDRYATVRRVVGSLGVKVLPINSTFGAMNVHDGDHVHIPAKSVELSGAVTFSGAVVRQGAFQHQEGDRVSSYITSLDHDLMPDADLEIGLILRRFGDRQEIEVHAFNLVLAVQSPGSVNDPLLRSHDEVIILPRVAEALADNDADEFDLDAEIDAVDDSSTTSLTREELLTPVIDRLKGQANPELPASVVYVQGAVRNPGEYPLTVGGEPRYLIELAGGLLDGAYLSNAELRRIDVDQVRGEVKTNIMAVNLSTDSGMRLISRDVLRINYLPDWNPDQRVTLSGEIQFPGTYYLREGETLASILQRAGGFTNEAFPEALRYISVATREVQKANVNRLVERFRRENASRVSVGVTEQYSSEVNDDYVSSVVDSFQGRIILDMPRILSGDRSADVLLQDGDVVEVPRLVETVTVVGEVYEPGTFRYAGGMDEKDYIALAAGLTERARKKNIYVIRANGSIYSLGKRKGLFRFSSTSSSRGALAPGSVVVVPTDYDYEKPLDKYRSITSVAFESVASIAAFFSITRK